MPENQRKTIDQIVNLPVKPSYAGGGTGLGNEAKSVLLGQVAQPTVSQGVNEVDRQDRVRYIAVIGNTDPRLRTALYKLQSTKKWPKSRCPRECIGRTA